MKDRPIIFSAPMVRALLDGRKTQTRRLAWLMPRVAIQVGDGPVEPIMPRSSWQDAQPGDRLWVREAWAFDSLYGPIRGGAPHIYRASWDDPRPQRWRPSIHMPRWASRLTLNLLTVRVEPLWDITEADAIAEGVTPSGENLSGHPLTPHVAAFSDLWIKLHNYATWASNPEVVVLTFNVAHRNIDA